MKIEQSISSTFAAYKAAQDGSMDHYDHVRGLTVAQCRDEVRFPLGLQHDARGPFVWTYGANDGVKF